jgi:AraC family transcriptional activator of mtrCDE
MKHSFLKEPGDSLRSYNVYCELWEEQPLHSRVHLTWRSEPYDPSFVTKTIACQEFDAWPLYLTVEHHPFLAELIIRIVEMNTRGDTASAAAANHLLFGWILEMNRIVHSSNLYDPRIQKIIRQLQRETFADLSFV